LFRERAAAVIPEVSESKRDILEKLYDVVAADIREDVLKGLAVEFDQLEVARASVLEAHKAAEEAMADVDRLRAATMEAMEVLRVELRGLSADRDALLERSARQAVELERSVADLDEERSKRLAYESKVATLDDLAGRLDRLNSEKETMLAAAIRDLGLVKAALEAESRISADVSNRLAQSQQRGDAALSTVQKLHELRDRLMAETKRLRNQLDRSNAKLSRERAASAQVADKLKVALEEVLRTSARLATGKARERDLEKLLAHACAEVSALQSRLEDKAKQCRVERAGRLAMERKCRRTSPSHIRDP
jgi:chromosome segregation ATPase